ncbi:unnamed protein product [Aureobasidium uvarum]|uniref:Uncharacterized protein n=1 Tax=Aureobasidium uvarum TaxID=2773716 RepID=A0A9N8KPT3_9PEZI|nr:unnamed protein product [Aureobasidium uvarum]
MAIGSTGCVAYNPSQRTAYGYVPSLAAGIVYCVLFGLSMIAHTFQAIKTRALWNLVFAVGCLSTSDLTLCRSLYFSLLTT